MKKSIIKNYIFNLTYQILSIILPLVTTPYLSRTLGSESIGIYGYTISIVTYFILFGSLGISMYSQREIAYVQDENKKRSKVFFEIFFLKCITLPISMFIFYITFCIRGEYQIYYKILLLYIIANIIDISWFFQGIEEFGKTVKRNIIVKILSLFLIFICIKSKNDLWKYLLIFSCSEILGNITMWIYLPKYITKVKVNNLKIWKHLVPTIILFIPQIATQIYTVLDKTMLGVITNDMNEVGFYEQAQKIVKTALTIVTAFGTVMAPRIANYYANNKKDEIISNIKKSFSFVGMVSIPIVFGLIGISKKFVPWFYGDGFEKVSALIILTSPIIIAIGLSNITGLQLLVPVGKQKEYTISVTVGAISNLILNIIFIKILQSIGATIASVISEIIVFIIQYYYIKDVIKIKEIIKIFLKYFLCGLIMLIVLLIIEKNMNISIINTIIQIVIGTIVYLFMLFVFKDKFLIKNFNILKERKSK